MEDGKFLSAVIPNVSANHQAMSNVGIDISAESWNLEMIDYPFVFDHKGHRYMLYNGNGYGKTGFGLAL